ncbi:MAG: GNAT family N-acetyltransferase [Gemmatimonadetes bacterium]|nr:GNAT family N-acetyltransferase [Gemmatimonadota bacterium]
MTQIRDFAAATAVRIREIEPGGSLKPFIDLAWTLNERDPNWIPPLRLTMATVLDRKKHPFHRNAEVAYFMAERRGTPVGRIAAILNRRHNEFHQEKTGFFGLFECEESEQTARALIDTAAEWLRSRGMERIRGPMNLSTNEEASSPGVLVEGFDTPPMIQMSHNPPYYGALLESVGLTKEKDVVAILLEGPDAPERIVRGNERTLKRNRVTIRPLNLKRFKEDVELLKQLYNASWARNWGFVPMSDAEFDHLAKEFRPVVDADLCLIAEIDGEPVGFSLTLPNLNEAIRHLPDGRLFPFGIFRLLWHRRKVRGVRVVTLGFKPAYQHLGLGPALYLRTWQTGIRKGYVEGEASWVLEDNHEMLRMLERMGGRTYKRFRIYEMDL